MPAFKCLKSVFASVILFAGLGSNAAPFTNGNFAIPALSAWSYLLPTNGSTVIAGWTVGVPYSGDVDLSNGSGDGIAPYAGQQLIIFNAGDSTPGGSLTQTFDTTVGEFYTVAFAVTQNNPGAMSLTATALAAGNSLLASNYCVPSTSGVWSLFPLTFTATTTSTTLVFTDTSTETFNVDLLFDDVTVTASQPATPPSIVTSPVSQTVASGAAVAFTASASGGVSTVQWYLINYQGTNAIAGATSTTLNVTASGATAGSYFAVFTNSGGSATTSAANLAVTGLALVNGSFENPVVSVAGGFGPGSTKLTGWTIGGPGANVSLWNGSTGGLSPYAGQQWAWFGGVNEPSGVSVAQTITTVVGQPYGVTYYVGESGTGSLDLSGTAYDAVGNLLASRSVPLGPRHLDSVSIRIYGCNHQHDAGVHRYFCG